MKAVLALMMCLLTSSVSSQIIISYQDGSVIKTDTIKSFKFLDIEFEPDSTIQGDDIILGGDFDLMFTSPYGWGEGQYLFLYRPVGVNIGESNALAEEWIVVAMDSEYDPEEYEYKLVATKKIK